MQLLIKRLDKTIPLPQFKTAGAAGFDLSSREDIIVPAHQTAFIPLNVIIKIPTGYHAILLPRSSMPKLGLMQVNSVGLIDEDYCGPEDEYKLFVLNYTNTQVKIEKGTRIAQVLIHQTVKPEIIEVETLDNLSRGGFGSTGQK